MKGIDPDKWKPINECPEDVVEKFWYHISSVDNIGKLVKGIDGPYLCFKDVEIEQYRVGFITENRVSDNCTSTWFMYSDFVRKNGIFKFGKSSFGARRLTEDCPITPDY